jgi:uncharacterized membrane protein YbhN (UPF0104 family)
MANDKLLHKQMLLPLLSFAAVIMEVVILLMTALVIWLTELIGSASLAALCLAGVFLLIAWMIYVVWTRPVVDYINEKLDTIYDVAFAARNGYEVVRSFALKLLFHLVKHP